MSDTSEGPHEGVDPVPEASAQVNLSIFDERSALFTDGFGQTCDQHGVELALAVVIDPEHPELPPIIFYRGGAYQIAKLTRELANRFRELVMQTLS